VVRRRERLCGKRRRGVSVAGAVCLTHFVNGFCAPRCFGGRIQTPGRAGRWRRAAFLHSCARRSARSFGLHIAGQLFGPRESLPRLWLLRDLRPRPVRASLRAKASLVLEPSPRSRLAFVPHPATSRRSAPAGVEAPSIEHKICSAARSPAEPVTVGRHAVLTTESPGQPHETRPPGSPGGPNLFGVGRLAWPPAPSARPLRSMPQPAPMTRLQPAAEAARHSPGPARGRMPVQRKRPHGLRIKMEQYRRNSRRAISPRPAIHFRSVESSRTARRNAEAQGCVTSRRSWDAVGMGLGGAGSN